MDPIIVLSHQIIAVPSLDTIPQSEAPSPQPCESPPREPLTPSKPLPHPQRPTQSFTPTDPVRNSSLLSSVSGTFQPKPSRYSSQPPSRSNPRSRSGSGRSTPSIRRNVPPIHIPPSTPEDPLFSAYPDNGDTPTDSKGKLKTSLLPPTFNRNLFKRGSYVPMSRSSSSPSVKQNRWSDKMPSPTSPSYQPRRRRSSSTPPQFSDHAEEEVKFVGPSRRPFDAG